ncbi:L-2-hydroxyglutarate dehydrogenase, mitochondrial-like isoform X2 [Zingiber officinale]|uniref:L-2-hydroxyglutarate dehydrogenase, mitochondrial-like isoform X2 n=1 Tax=Zingiber officinale TaxID=94328 RepID=UPI001C4C5561|nr:L-2-hydroxyglutarate dehydrogenase, mitochondrial-like isoform X2 [Zingiber officinale]
MAATARKAITSFEGIAARAVRTVGCAYRGIAREAADVVVIGAGVVGIAVARELASKGREVLVVEAASTFGTGTSSRNSEVIHAGIYYPSTSLKANLCLRGKELLYKYCSDREIAHKKVGKLIVATSEGEIPKLERLLKCGNNNGVDDLRIMDGFQAMQIEPELQCVKALLSPSSGIIDSHSLMLSLVGEAESDRTTFSYNTTVIGGHVEDDFLHLHIYDSDSLHNVTINAELLPQFVLSTRLVINSAGLSAIPLAKRFPVMNKEISCYYARGCYFTLTKTKVPPFSHLIYPIPEDGGLGVHVTLDLNDLVKFGPDVEWIDGVDDLSCFSDRFDYSVKLDQSKKFYPEIRKYFPNLKDGSLEPGYSGIRPKLSGPGKPLADFVIQGEDVHGVPGLVNLFGIESPGLTSSLAIAEYIVSKYSS